MASLPYRTRKNIRHHPGLILRMPEPMLHSGDLDGDFIEVPLVTNSRQPPLDLVCELLAELERPLPHGFMTDHDAAGRHHVLDHAQAEREAKVQPHRLANHLGWEAL